MRPARHTAQRTPSSPMEAAAYRTDSRLRYGEHCARTMNRPTPRRPPLLRHGGAHQLDPVERRLGGALLFEAAELNTSVGDLEREVLADLALVEYAPDLHPDRRVALERTG